MTFVGGATADGDLESIEGGGAGQAVQLDGDVRDGDGLKKAGGQKAKLGDGRAWSWRKRT